MTREEIISNLLYMKRSVKEDTIEDRTIDEAIKALEQEPILDKIRAEIPKLVCCENEYRQALVKVADVIKCVDKHRVESEGK